MQINNSTSHTPFIILYKLSRDGDARHEKPSAPHDSAACRSNNFSVGLYRSLTSLWRNFSPLVFTTLLQVIELCGYLLLLGSL